MSGAPNAGALPRPLPEPLHFGGREEPLFGVHHRPTGGAEKRVGVVLCPPRGHEYIVTHPAYRHLAERLAGEGFHVLRFDFFGCGDSAGACEDGRPARWLEDLSRAVGELRIRSGHSRTVLVGCRLGATLAAEAAAERGDVQALVLWDPVVSGPAHVTELSERHRAMLRRAHVHLEGVPGPSDEVEILGFAFPDGLRRELDTLDLLALDRRPAPAVLLVESDAESADALARHLEGLGTRVERRSVPARDPWTWIEDASLLVPREVVDTIVAWLRVVGA